MRIHGTILVAEKYICWSPTASADRNFFYPCVAAVCPLRLRRCFACGEVGHARVACRSRASQRIRQVTEGEEEVHSPLKVNPAPEERVLDAADGLPGNNGKSETFYVSRVRVSRQ